MQVLAHSDMPSIFSPVYSMMVKEWWVVHMTTWWGCGTQWKEHVFMYFKDTLTGSIHCRSVLTILIVCGCMYLQHYAFISVTSTVWWCSHSEWFTGYLNTSLECWYRAVYTHINRLAHVHVPVHYVHIWYTCTYMYANIWDVHVNTCSLVWHIWECV